MKPTVIALLLFLTRSAWAQAEPALTADEVAGRAAATSFDVRARAEETAAARAAVDRALAAYYPRLSGAARYQRLSEIPTSTIGNLVAAPTAGPGPLPAGTPLVNVPLSFPILLDSYTLSATMQVPLSDYLLRLPQGHAAAKLGRRSAELTEQASQLRVATDARVLYYSWLRARSQVTVAEQALEQARGHLADARHAADAGAASKADVLRVESQVASSELLVERTRNLAQLLEQQLRTAMHDESARSYVPGDSADGDVPAPDALPALWNEAFERRLELRALAAAADAAREQAKIARAGWFPRVDAVGDALYANPNPRILPQQDRFTGSWDLSLQLSWTPSDIPAATADKRGAEARGREIDAQRALAHDGVRIEVMQAHQALQEARVATETTARGLTAAEESYRVRRVLFQNGRATSVELTDAETELTRARLDALAARIDLHIASARLQHAVGRDIARN